MDGELEARVRELEQDNAADQERFKSIEKAHRELYPLVELYGRLDERFNTVLRDLGAAHDAIRTVEEEVEAAQDANRDLGRLVETAREERNAQIAEVKSAGETRALELQAQAEAQASQARIENRRMLAGLFGIFLTAAATILTAILTGGPA